MTACIEHVPTHIRYTGVVLAYYINYGFFGGISGDHIEKLLIEDSCASSPIFYLMAGSFIVLICSYFLKEEAGQVLSDNDNKS